MIEVPFSAIVTPQSVSFTAVDGKVYNIDSSHREWKNILDTIKELQIAMKYEAEHPYVGPEYKATAGSLAIRQNLLDLVDVSQKINSAGAGKVTVRDGVVYYIEEPVHSAITERILWGLNEGFDMTAYMAFLDNAMENPSNRAVTEMYSFMERNNMGITEDGYILGYKKVKEDFKDIYTGKMDNSPGQIVEMIRNKVNDNPNETCSHGLHFCAMSYLSKYGTARGNKIVIVKVNPADIVSVPIDYDFAKVRCCKYEVLAEYTGPDVEDLLGSKPVWGNDDSFEWTAEDDANGLDDDFGEIDDQDDYEPDYAYCEYCGEDIPDCICDTDSDVEDIEAKIENEVEDIIAEFEDIIEEVDEVAKTAADLAAIIALESGTLTLTDEGSDMRHIMDSVEHPVSQDTAEMRTFIEAVEHPDPSKAGPVEYPDTAGVVEMKKFIDAVNNPDTSTVSPVEHATAVMKSLVEAVENPNLAQDKSEKIKVIQEDGSISIDALRRLSDILKEAVDKKGDE
jgi:hypothetical protein